eukprot:4135508-Pyramimonas_sp.AAC.1
MAVQVGMVLAGMAIIKVWHSINKTIPPSLICIGALTAVAKVRSRRTARNSLARLAPAPGICPLPSRGWLPRREHARSPRA